METSILRELQTFYIFFYKIKILRMVKTIRRDPVRLIFTNIGLNMNICGFLFLKQNKFGDFFLFANLSTRFFDAQTLAGV